MKLAIINENEDGKREDGKRDQPLLNAVSKRS